MIVVLNKENFKEEVLNSDKPVLVDFFAEWCPPCRALSAIIEELAEKYIGKIKIAKLSIEEGQEIALDYKVMSVPTLIIFQGGKEEKRMVGLQSKEELEKVLTPL